MDITGREGLTLKDKWSHGPRTYLGLTIAGIPNLFAVTGPGSPSVLSNMVVSIEQHVDWIAGCLEHMRREGLAVIEATEAAEAGWVQHVNDFGDITLFPRANSWYMGSNVPGKPRVFLPYVGGVGTYRTICDEVVTRDYLGFRLAGPAGIRVNHGIIRRVQPDVAIMLDIVRGLGLPAMETMPVEQASRARRHAGDAAAAGTERRRVRRRHAQALPAIWRIALPSRDSGPHPIVVTSTAAAGCSKPRCDDPFCRDLCVRSNAIVISADYRHAPEARFPLRQTMALRRCNGSQRTRSRWGYTRPRRRGGMERWREHRRRGLSDGPGRGGPPSADSCSSRR